MDNNIITEKEFTDAIKFLIYDEYEAIKGYDKAIEKLNGKVTGKVISRLKEIRGDEQEHIEELEELLK